MPQLASAPFLVLLFACSGVERPEPSVTIQCQEGARVHWTDRADGIEHWCQRDGAMTGAYVRFHPDGSVAARGQYRANQPVGEWMWWHPDGRLARKGGFAGGEPARRWNWWHPNGQLAVSGEYSAGLKSGTWTAWHDNGQRAEEGMYVNDVKDGQWTYWDRQGHELRTEVWRGGERAR